MPVHTVALTHVQAVDNRNKEAVEEKMKAEEEDTGSIPALL